MSSTANLRVAALEPAASVGARALRNALGRFATGVTVIATRCGKSRVHGMTVNSFTSLSLEPALILWTLRTASARYATFAHCELFSVNVLAENQLDIARRHARARPGVDASTWHGFRSECPVVEGASAQFVCRSRNVVHQGDHAILIGEIVDYAEFDRGPLLFVAGDYFSGSALTPL
jgi:flavin reductase (DIM6/NTAB) family NADH-FMN oxidoreductase RutF